MPQVFRYSYQTLLTNYKDFIIVKKKMQITFKSVKISGKIMEMEFPGDMHIYTLCLNSLQSFWKFVQWFKRICAYKKKPGLTD